MPDYQKAKIRVCVNVNCCARGSEKVYDALQKEMGSEAEIVKTPDCFRFCKIGPNVSVNGNVLHGVGMSGAVSRVRREIKDPSRKVDGLGMKSIDELDDVLDNLFL